ncbi:MAG: hypothetical protein ABMB14_39645, partial [Myxococcota bacterium]
MGVLGTNCQICGLPVQHDHYVPTDGWMLGIWRGPGTTHCASAVAFGPEHDWLLDAVALRLGDRGEPAVVEGRVQDGVIRGLDGGSLPDGFVCDGVDERAAVHRACWRIAGAPASWAALAPRVVAGADDVDLAPYCGQLFELAALVEDGHGWMLVALDLLVAELRQDPGPAPVAVVGVGVRVDQHPPVAVLDQGRELEQLAAVRREVDV